MFPTSLRGIKERNFDKLLINSNQSFERKFENKKNKKIKQIFIPHLPISVIIRRKMLMNVLRILTSNPFKESFYEKKINVLTSFFIFYKNCQKFSKINY